GLTILSDGKETNTLTENFPIEQKKEKSIEEIGISVATFVLDAFAVFASGDFASWQKDRTIEIESDLNGCKNKEESKERNLVCERILVEKMKEKEFSSSAVPSVRRLSSITNMLSFTSRAVIIAIR
ncbi:hypothetical protein PMAYCL1PPCAC_01562, partial [Pristionchus mayeri]